MRKTIAGLVAMLAPVGAVAQPAECQVFQNAIIVSEEGEYLGKLASKYDQDSITSTERTGAGTVVSPSGTNMVTMGVDTPASLRSMSIRPPHP